MAEIAKRKTNKQGNVLVLIHKAIAYGGLHIGPTRNGNKVTPTQAVIPLDVAEAHTEDRLEILNEVPADGAKVGAVPPAAK